MAQKTEALSEPAALFPASRKRTAAQPAGRRLSRWFRRVRADDPEREDLHRLVQRLYLDMGVESPRYSVLLTSPGSAEAAVAGALRLARYLAEDPSRRVLLVDACLRRRDLSCRLGDGLAPGLLDYLDGSQRTWRNLVRGAGADGVSLLSAGRSEQDVHALLKGDPSGRLISMLEEAKDEFGFVMVVAPSLLSSSYSVVFPSLVDCVLMVVRPGVTRRNDAAACKQALDACRARRVGIVVAGA